MTLEPLFKLGIVIMGDAAYSIGWREAFYITSAMEHLAAYGVGALPDAAEHEYVRPFVFNYNYDNEHPVYLVCHDAKGHCHKFIYISNDGFSRFERM